jgi:sec-independent protein translocase protein TatB
MFDSIGFQELILIGLVGLLVVGPKELPVLMRKAGQMMNKMRGMAADFRATFDEMARQSELDELRKEVEALRNNNPISEIRDELTKPFDTGPFDTGPFDTGPFDTGSSDTGHVETGVDPFSPVPAEHPVMTPLADLQVVSEPKPKKPRKPRAKKASQDAAAEDVPA